MEVARGIVAVAIGTVVVTNGCGAAKGLTVVVGTVVIIGGCSGTGTGAGAA
eukprot:CAMPEP_0194492786 /NCGR_PEP_ID=MMETSP0253-20130528/11217_1 /TAXON_ID=2966 /ORGANISM="Noctiluca scintillans" /LENGTH=50 /DNA_ID=CAMNT_0039333693 /DNA_START=205 /DNA_END=354 /DNA_ORIENTATION=+